MKKTFIVSVVMALFIFVLSVGISITSGVDAAPCVGTPTNPSPSDKDTDIVINVHLNWDDCSNATYYQVVFDTNPSPSTLVGNPNNSDLALSTLNYSTTYYWQVTAFNGSTCNMPGPVWNFTTECGYPSIPINASPSTSATNISVDADLDWDNCSNTTYYQVYFGTNPSPSTLVGSPNDSIWPLPTLNSSTTYYWKVVANNGCGHSTNGSVWSFTTTCGIPSAPVIPNPGNGSSQKSVETDLSWDTCVNTSSYDVYFGTSPSPSALVGSPTANSWPLSTLNPNTTYYWKVVSNNVCGSNNSSAIWNFTTGCPVVGTAANPYPANASAIVPITVTLDWDNCSYATFYRVYCDTNTSPSTLVGNPNDSSWTPTGLIVNTTYYWKVVANNSCNSSSGPIWTFFTGCPVPSMPASPVPFNGSSPISIYASLSWGNCSNTSSYDVYFGTSPSPSALIASPTTNSCTLTTLTPSTTYYWKVVAKNGCGSNNSSPIWNFFTGCVAPSAPASPFPADGSSGLSLDSDLSWGASSSAANYQVYFGTSPSFGSPVVTATNSLPLSTLNISTTYYWKVVANNSCGNTSGSSSTWVFTTGTGCTVPSKPLTPSYPGNGSSNISTSVTLSWAACINATSYNVYLGTFPTLATYNNTTNTSYPVSLNYSTKYYWQVVANSSCGTNASDVWSFTTACAAVPAKPQTPYPVNLSVNVSTSLTLDWADCANASSYDVYLSTSSTPTYYGNTSNSSYQVSLNYSTKYYWKVVANSSCGTNASDVWSFTTICLTAPSKPQTPTPGNGSVNISTSVLLDWADSANASLYDVYLSTSSTPTYYGNTSNSSYQVSLSNSTQYYWKVVANNSCGTNSSDVWNFTTASVSASTPTPTPEPTPTPINIGGTSVSWNISSSGVIQHVVDVTSADGKINVHIPAGTTALNSAGGPLYNLNVSTTAVYPAVSGGRTVIAAFDFSPNGATFNPGIVVTLSYTHAMIPAGVNESKLVVAFYNMSSASWESISNAVVNPSANTITCTITHFTVFAIQAPPVNKGISTMIWVIIGVACAVAIVLGVVVGLYLKRRRTSASLYYEDDEGYQTNQTEQGNEEDGDFKF